MFINVAAEATTAIMIIFMLSFDEVSFIWIFEQSNLVDAKILVLWILFLVDFIDVSRGTSVCVAGTNLVIGS